MTKIPLAVKDAHPSPLLSPSIASDLCY